jgi:hypothetical protein
MIALPRTRRIPVLRPPLPGGLLVLAACSSFSLPTAESSRIPREVTAACDAPDRNEVFRQRYGACLQARGY